MSRQDLGVAVAQLLEEARGPLDVGEEEGCRPGRWEPEIIDLLTPKFHGEYNPNELAAPSKVLIRAKRRPSGCR